MRNGCPSLFPIFNRAMILIEIYSDKLIRGGIKLLAGGWNQELKILAGSFLNIIFYWPFFSIKYYIWLRKTSHLKFDESNSLDPEQNPDILHDNLDGKIYKWLMEIQITWLPLLNNSIIWNLAWKSWKLKLKNYSVSALAEFAGWRL